MKILKLLESGRSGFTKREPLSLTFKDKFVNIYRAQPSILIEFTSGSYVTRSLKFAKEHAISQANYEDEQHHVIKAYVLTKDVYNADNPGEFIYDGPPIKGKSIFTANPGDDFDIINEEKSNKKTDHKHKWRYLGGCAKCIDCDKYVQPDGTITNDKYGK